jgi:hypothetical protein
MNFIIVLFSEFGDCYVINQSLTKLPLSFFLLFLLQVIQIQLIHPNWNSLAFRKLYVCKAHHPTRNNPFDTIDFSFLTHNGNLNP